MQSLQNPAQQTARSPPRRLRTHAFAVKWDHTAGPAGDAADAGEDLSDESDSGSSSARDGGGGGGAVDITLVAAATADAPAGPPPEPCAPSPASSDLPTASSATTTSTTTAPTPPPDVAGPPAVCNLPPPIHPASGAVGPLNNRLLQRTARQHPAHRRSRSASGEVALAAAGITLPPPAARARVAAATASAGSSSGGSSCLATSPLAESASDIIPERPASAAPPAAAPTVSTTAACAPASAPVGVHDVIGRMSAGTPTGVAGTPAGVAATAASPAGSPVVAQPEPPSPFVRALTYCASLPPEEVRRPARSTHARAGARACTVARMLVYAEAGGARWPPHPCTRQIARCGVASARDGQRRR